MSVRIGHRGDRWVELGPWHAVSGEPLRFCDVAGVLLFLRERTRPGDLRTLRGLLDRDDPTTHRLDDAVVLQRVAHRLHTRALKAVVSHDRRHAHVEPQRLRLPRIELPAPAPRGSLQLPPQPTPPPIVARPPPLPADFDPVAQAVALRQAAREGVPFCEVCQRPPVTASAPRPPTTTTTTTAPTDLADIDPIAQASALRDAARDGTPLCEVCRKPA